MVNLSETVSVDPSLIQKAVFKRAGAKIDAKLAILPSGAIENLTTPEDEVIVHSRDESVVIVRGAEAQRAWDLLKKLQSEQKVSFEMTAE